MKAQFLFFFLASILLFGCGNSIERKEATGFTQGTTYSVIYFNQGADFQYQIDSLLLSFDRVLSTYQKSSYISKWNTCDVASIEQPKMFKEVLKSAMEVNKVSDGAFDITVSPLMKYWFESDWKLSAIDSSKVDSIMEFVGMQRLTLKDGVYGKTDPRIQLDVNANAQGYSVDVVAQFLQTQGVNNYLVEIGGEVRANGFKPNDEPWKVGIDQPSENRNSERQLALTVELTNKSLATSGNYRKFVEINGQKFGHSLNPVSGYPAKTDVLSATVIAKDCMTADAYATACMVLGFEKAKALISENKHLEAVLIYSDFEGIKTWRSELLAE